MNFPPITHVTCLHGDETVPMQILKTTKIPFLVGNPEALKQNRRYIDQDLNSSFETNNDTYESLRAQELLDQIPDNNWVVDWHTFTDTSEPFTIVVDLDMLPLAKMIGFTKVLYMKFNNKHGHSLLDHRNGVSVEVGQHNSEQAFKNTRCALDNLSQKKRIAVEVYEVFDEITKPGLYLNFETHSDGFIPVLANGADYLGLKARRL